MVLFSALTFSMYSNHANVATKDIVAAIKRYSLVGMLGWQDIRQRYRRSALGPFWLTISMGIMIGTIGVVFGGLFKTPLDKFLPFLSIGMILWAFVSGVVTDGCVGFVSAEGIIKQLPIPLFVHILRLVWRNIIMFAHNVVIFPLAMFALGQPIGWVALLSIAGFLVLVVNVTWIALLLAILCTRYRDLPQIVASLLLIAFYLTPIMWMPAQLSGNSHLYLLNGNPIYHALEIVRAPLIGQFPTALNWEVSVGMAVLGWIVTCVVYGRYRHRIAYWL